MAEEATPLKAVEFFTMQLGHLAEGGFHISLTATTMDDEEPQLLYQEIASEQVATLDDALAVIRAGVLGASTGSR